jgi:hypothetical protein
LSHEIANFAGAEAVKSVEGNMCGTDKKGEVPSLRRGQRPHHVRKGMRWNLRDLMPGHRLKSRLARIGKARSRSR